MHKSAKRARTLKHDLNLNYVIFKFFCLCLCFICIDLATGLSQPCQVNFGAIYGIENQIERGYSLAPRLENDGFYLSGLKNDSVLIARFSLTGEVLWARLLDVVPGSSDHAWTLIVDNEGMLAIAGYSGNPSSVNSIFVFRYNPNSHQVLWTKEIIPSVRGYTNALIQKENGGNYLFCSNPHEVGNDDCLILEIDKATGSINNSFRKNYNLGGSEALGDIVLKEGFIYGCGRFTDGFSTADMRHAIIKLNENDGSQVWCKLGHKPKGQTARLYGTDIINEGNFIYTIYHGDPSGTSLTNTKCYIQKTDLNGNYRWLKHYELPGNNDACYEIVKSGNEFVVLAHQKAVPAGLIMFKIDDDGNVIWSYMYQFPNIVNPPTADGPVSALITVADKLVFTAYSANASGGNDLILVITDEDGRPNQPCVQNNTTSITVNEILNPSFYNVGTTITNRPLQQRNHAPQVRPTLLSARQECFEDDTLFTQITASICEGESYSGYMESGVYIDSFTSFLGCDSIRNLNLTVIETSIKTEQVEICGGESYSGYTETGIYIDTMQSVNGCDSIRILELQVNAPETIFEVQLCEGETFEGYSITGTYTDTLKGNFNNCDTIRHIFLEVLPVYSILASHTICQGDTFLGYFDSGIYTDTFKTIDGCDSVRVLDLTVTNEVWQRDTVTICMGEEYLGYSDAGIYLDTLQAIAGCDSIYQLELHVVPMEVTYDIEICRGANFFNYSETGMYIDTIYGQPNACDTIRHLNLTVLPIIENILEVTICEGAHYEGYSNTGVFTDTLHTEIGCDSVRTVMLTVAEDVEVLYEGSVCDYISQGISSPGMYIDTFDTYYGCDSIRTLVITGGRLYIPNVFSPNDDGINDVFTVFDFPVNEIDLQYFAIFDRFGNMAYETKNWPIKWSGVTLKDRSYQNAVFAYVLIYLCNEKRIIERGNITLVK